VDPFEELSKIHPQIELEIPSPWGNKHGKLESM
jgi:hypothetical protein